MFTLSFVLAVCMFLYCQYQLLMNSSDKFIPVSFMNNISLLTFNYM